MLNKCSIPSGRPYGQAFQTKNDVTGLGDYLGTFDNDADCGSAGQLQHIVALYKLRYSAANSSSFLVTGPTVHEMGHRWFNFSSTYFYGSHWPAGTISGGIFGGVWNNMAEIELYLMGLIDYSDITNGSTDQTYADAFISESGTLSPGTGSSQKSFRGLVVVVTPNDMTSEEISITDNGGMG